MRLSFGWPMLAAVLAAAACSNAEAGAPAQGGASGAGAGGTAGASAGSAAGGAAGGAGEAGDGGGGVGALAVEGVATWRGAAKGAYSIIHDDLCDYNIDSLFDVAEPELTARGLSAGFGAIVQRCEERDLWARLETLRGNGHEIICHSWTHPDLVVDAPDLALEIDHATTVLDSNLAGQSTSFFIFPYDSFNDTLLERLRGLGYLGARAGEKGVSPADFPDGMRVRFDVYGGVNSIYDGQGDILKIYVDLAIAEGGWANREFHGIADETFFPVPLADYTAHLDYVRSRVDARELWMATPSGVINYRFAREHCGTPSAVGSSLEFAARSPDCAKYEALLSVIVTTGTDVDTLHAEQDGAPLTTTKLGPSRYVVDIVPTGGPTAISGD